VATHGTALCYAAISLRQNRQIVQTAVANDAWALQYASPELRNDRDIALSAVLQNGAIINYDVVSLALRSSDALRWAAETDHPLLCAQLRSVMVRVVSCSRLTGDIDIVETIGGLIVPETVIEAMMDKHGYCLSGARTCPKKQRTV
jgi:hypothetical protein